MKQFYQKLDSDNFGKLISTFEKIFSERNFKHLKSFFEDKMMSQCEEFTLKAIAACNKAWKKKQKNLNSKIKLKVKIK